MGVRMVCDWGAGAGTFTSASGDEYVGEYKDDTRDGQGEARAGRLQRGGRRGRMVPVLSVRQRLTNGKAVRAAPLGRW